MTDNPDAGLRRVTADELWGAIRKRATRTEWGNWKYNGNNFTLELWDERGLIYYVDLERCATSSQVLDWVFQIRQKTWATANVVKSLLDALRDLIDPQANLCSFGESKTINPKKLLSGRKAVAI